MSFYSSINFTDEHRKEITELLNYDALTKEHKKKYDQRFEQILKDWKPTRVLYVLEDESCRGNKIGITNDIV